MREDGHGRPGLHVAALVPLYTRTAELTREGLPFEYLDYESPTPLDRCIYTGGPDGCVKYLPSDVSQPENADGNAIPGALRDVLVRAGLTVGIAVR